MFAIGLSTTAFAHRNDGTYTLTRATRTLVEENGAWLPVCDPDEPIPAELFIKYSGPDASVVVVNGDEWQRGGLTTDRQGRTNSRPFRVARKPNPPSGTTVTVVFRRDGERATAMMDIIRSDPRGSASRCVTSYRFDGKFSP